jgi:hypothetical protein
LKVSDQMRFPHPVLWDVTDDYASGEFKTGPISVEERIDTGEVTLSYSLELRQPDILELIQQGRARAGFFISCGDTYFSRLIPTDALTGDIRIVSGELSGRVVLRPFVWATQGIPDYRPSALHREFAESPYIVSLGTVLAIGDAATLQVGRDKLASIASIFQLAEDNRVPPFQVALQLDGDRISINAETATHKLLNQMRSRKTASAVLLNSVFLPAVMSVLTTLRQDSNIYEGRRWYRVFTAKMDHLGINIKVDPLQAAQKLLESPLQRIANEFEGDSL